MIPCFISLDNSLTYGMDWMTLPRVLSPLSVVLKIKVETLIALLSSKEEHDVICKGYSYGRLQRGAGCLKTARRLYWYVSPIGQ